MVQSTHKYGKYIFSKIKFYSILMLSLLLSLSALLLISCKGKGHSDLIEIANANSSQSIDSPISIKALKKRDYDANLIFEKKLEDSPKYDSDLYSYYSDSLKIYALVNTPKIEIPEGGFPILVFGHGFHPEPKKYGVSNITGKDWRPGDYYRGVPEAYAQNGFLTITPDYRGHNISAGFEFTKSSYLASTYYAIDVLHLLEALSDLENVDVEHIYFMGHSMGVDVGLKMLLATDRIKAASLWSGVSATTWEQAIYYGKWSDEESNRITHNSMKNYLTKLDSVIQALGFKYDINSGDPIHFIEDITQALIIHHATNETSVPYQWSESLAAKLFKHGKEFEFYSYESENHLFKDKNLKKAIERDVAFFNRQ